MRDHPAVSLRQPYLQRRPLFQRAPLIPSALFLLLAGTALLPVPRIGHFQGQAAAVPLRAASAADTPAAKDRSPLDLALSPDGRFALTANATSDTVSLVSLQAHGSVLREVKVGRRPFAVALSRPGTQAVVTNYRSNSVSVLAVSPSVLRVSATIPVGEEPRGVALSPEGRRAYVALSGENALAIVDLQKRAVIRKIPVGTEPWHVALTEDGKRLVVGNARSQDVSVLNATTLKPLHRVRLKGNNARHIALSPTGDWAYVPHISERGRPVTKQNIDLGWVIGNRLSRVPLQEEGPREAIALDPRGKAVGDVDGVAVSPDGKMIALTAGGTHELLLLRLPLPFVAYGGPGDHIEKDLLEDSARFRRIPLGGRPLGVAFAGDGKTVVVSNYLGNSVQIVDTDTGQITRTIALGGSPAPSIARQGEAIFHDATRSFHQWYSCASCHVEGHTNGSNFDTFNDGSYETPKKTLSLRGVAKTGPWTWHGWQPSLRQLVRDSMTKSMQGPEPADPEVDAVLAYLETLTFLPAKADQNSSAAAAAKRGEIVFRSRACDTCHAPSDYTSSGVYTVGLEAAEDVHKGFNPPPLRGVRTRAPYLHQGQAQTLEEVLTRYHRPSQVNGKPDLSATERKDLIEFLKSL